MIASPEEVKSRDHLLDYDRQQTVEACDPSPKSNLPEEPQYVLSVPMTKKAEIKHMETKQTADFVLGS